MDRKRKSKDGTFAAGIKTDHLEGELRDLNLKAWDGAKGTDCSRIVYRSTS